MEMEWRGERKRSCSTWSWVLVLRKFLCLEVLCRKKAGQLGMLHLREVLYPIVGGICCLFALCRRGSSSGVYVLDYLTPLEPIERPSSYRTHTTNIPTGEKARSGFVVTRGIRTLPGSSAPPYPFYPLHNPALDSFPIHWILSYSTRTTHTHLSSSKSIIFGQDLDAACRQRTASVVLISRARQVLQGSGEAGGSDIRPSQAWEERYSGFGWVEVWEVVLKG